MAKILIVEDNEMNRDMLSRRLERKGFSVVMAEDGQKGVDMSKSESPDLILMDLSLPIMDGWQATTTIKSDDHTKNIPIIMITAKGEESDIIKGLEVGADDYVTKPFSISILSARIKSILRRNSYTEKSSINSFEELSIEVNSREVYVDKKRID